MNACRFGTALLVSTLSIAPAAAQPAAIQQQQADRHFRAGMDALVSERWDRAETEFRAAVTLDPSFDAAFYGLGQTYMATRRYPEAADAYKNARTAFLNGVAAQALEANATDQRIQDQILALKDAIRVLSRRGQSGPQQNVQAGIARLEDQVLQLESRRARKSSSPPPPVPAGYSMALGSAYFRLGQLADAEREYKAAIEVNPAFGEAHNNLAVVYMMTNRLDAAEQAVQAAEKAGFKVNPQFKEDLKKRRGSVQR